jgi:hypothetical protein
MMPFPERWIACPCGSLHPAGGLTESGDGVPYYVCAVTGAEMPLDRGAPVATVRTLVVLSDPGATHDPWGLE